MDYGAAWALIENMLLAATAEGVGSVVHIPVKKEPEQIKAFLNVPDGWECPPWWCLVMRSKTRSCPLAGQGNRWKTKFAGTNGEKSKGRRRCYGI